MFPAEQLEFKQEKSTEYSEQMESQSTLYCSCFKKACLVVSDSVSFLQMKYSNSHRTVTKYTSNAEYVTPAGDFVYTRKREWTMNAFKNSKRWSFSFVFCLLVKRSSLLLLHGSIKFGFRGWQTYKQFMFAGRIQIGEGWKKHVTIAIITIFGSSILIESIRVCT